MPIVMWALIRHLTAPNCRQFNGAPEALAKQKL
jgi:hypothetical protein